MGKLPWVIGLPLIALACAAASVWAPRTPGPSSPSFLFGIATIVCMVAWGYVATVYNRERGGWEWPPRRPPG